MKEILRHFAIDFMWSWWCGASVADWSMIPAW